MLNFTRRTRSGLVFLAVSALLPLGFAQDKPVRHTSAPAETSVTINGKKIAIKYSAPSTYGRKIFGEMLPYGKVWRAGANSATALTTEADLTMDGLKVPAGSYTIYALPGDGDWQLIINKQTGQWGTVYDQGQDLGRVKMKVTQSDTPIETYKMTLANPGGNKGTLTLSWENTVASVSFTAQ